MQSVGFDHERAGARSHVLTTAPTSAAESSLAADFTVYVLLSIAVPGTEQKEFPDTARICMGNPHTNSVWQIHIQILYGKSTYKKSPPSHHHTADMVPPTNFPGFR